MILLKWKKKLKKLDISHLFERDDIIILHIKYIK